MVEKKSNALTIILALIVIGLIAVIFLMFNGTFGSICSKCNCKEVACDCAKELEKEKPVENNEKEEEVSNNESKKDDCLDTVSTSNNEDRLTYSDVKGHYVTNYSKGNIDVGYDMYLYEDGTLVANAMCNPNKNDCVTNGGFIGNYVIDSEAKKIKINYLFILTGGEEVVFTKDEESIEFKNDDIIFTDKTRSLYLEKTTKQYEGSSFDDYLKNIADY